MARVIAHVKRPAGMSVTINKKGEIKAGPYFKKGRILLGKIKREKGFNYYVDGRGRVFEAPHFLFNGKKKVRAGTRARR